jgi:predicted Zn finger-like uncharacterized protein
VEKKEVNMLISCPKCNAVYKLSDDKLPKDGKRFKCAECGKIWTVHNEDIKNIEPEIIPVKSQIVRPATSFEQTKDVEDMFQRLSKNTDNLFNELPQTSKKERKSFHPWQTIKNRFNMIFTPIVVNTLLFVAIVILSAFILIYNRYRIVNSIPQLEKVYASLGLESIYTGRDIVFQNVEARNIKFKDKHLAEISGIIYNKGQLRAKMPLLEAVMQDKDGNTLQEITQEFTVKRLDSNVSSIFRVIFENNTNEAKNVVLRFITKK